MAAEVKAAEEIKEIKCPVCKVNYISPEKGEKLCSLCFFREENKKNNKVILGC